MFDTRYMKTCMSHVTENGNSLNRKFSKVDIMI